MDDRLYRISQLCRRCKKVDELFEKKNDRSMSMIELNLNELSESQLSIRSVIFFPVLSFVQSF